MDERTEKILAKLRAGCTYAAIGKGFGVSRQRIEQIAKKCGLQIELREKREIERVNWSAIRRAGRISFLEKKSRIQDAVQAVSGGMHPAQAAIKYRVRYQSLTNAMTNAGVRSTAPRERPKYSPFKIAAVRELVEQTDLDNDEISWSTNVSYLTVRTVRRHYGRGQFDLKSA